MTRAPGYAPAVARIVNRGVAYTDEVTVSQHGDEVWIVGRLSLDRITRLTRAGYTVIADPDFDANYRVRKAP